MRPRNISDTATVRARGRVVAWVETMNTFTSIRVEVDATATAQPALERAAESARKCGAPLRIVDVMSAPADARRALRADLEDELMARRREKLARLAYGLRDVVAETDILAGTPVDALIEDVERFGHDLLVRSHARDVAARGPDHLGPLTFSCFDGARARYGLSGPVHDPNILGSLARST
jgi:nucleotide-binding universal stress UspA family protein